MNHSRAKRKLRCAIRFGERAPEPGMAKAAACRRHPTDDSRQILRDGDLQFLAEGIGHLLQSRNTHIIGVVLDPRNGALGSPNPSR